jgi:hypothetical protein
MRGGRDLTVALLTTLSSATFLAVERGNADLIMFLLIIIALNLHLRSLPFRLLGYALITLAGLLKFYPFMALIIVLRERIGICLAVIAAAALALGALVLEFHTELVWMARNLPAPSYYTLQFGAADLAVGLGVALSRILAGSTDPAAAKTIAMVLSRVLPVIAIAIAFVLARSTSLVSSLRLITGRERAFLLAGGAVICGCFFVGQSILYRGIFLLLVLPGVAGLARRLPACFGRTLIDKTTIAAVFVLWVPFLEAYLSIFGLTRRVPAANDAYADLPTSPAGFALWLTSELAWWWIVTVLLAVLGAFVASTVITGLRARVARERHRMICADSSVEAA